MKKYILTLLIVCSYTATTTAQNINPRLIKIDSLLSHFYKNDKFMGSVAIQEKDEVIFKKAYGYADVKNGIEANTETQYKIGSITKMFTASIIFQLIEERKLSFDTKLSEYFPEIKNADSITIKNMLNHTSGIFNYTNDGAFMAYLGSKMSHKEMVEQIAAFEPAFKPGTTADYSNSNYLLLGYIIEQVTGKPYKDAVEKRIVKKLKLKNTDYFSKINPQQNEAFSYGFDGTNWIQQEEWNESVAGAAGALQSTPEDLTKFIRALFKGDIIKQKSLDEMLEMDFGYGKGIFIFPFGERKFYGHNGGIEEFTSILGYYPKEEFAISLIINGSNYDYNEILIGILSIYYKMPYKFPNLKTANVAPEILKGYEGLYSSPTIPLKITITYDTESNKLMAQATGQGAFPLNPVSDTEFTFDPAQITIIFKENGFTIKQGGMVNEFTRE
ncbi:D-Ala-D-Ala carboxypeptidase [Flavobacterium suaedae]|uniref:D-Ala-D-Ala carboxypeptidase n=1 Tax=Flavobacterium suaedae TaxID=1767027 RepID=A0ABQ1JLK0_9FLAO|nr:serine hydrolase domain-containing protein [Flavobacterium suaedae]GGB69769.1 D-Ala-D-Ala carboxypeptidase [Flavobacterium suaedae]